LNLFYFIFLLKAITFLKQFSSDFKQNHQREITLLSTITSSIQARQMPFLQQFEHSKYKINISLKLYIVLFSYIEDNSLYLEFHIVSRYISFQSNIITYITIYYMILKPYLTIINIYLYIIYIYIYIFFFFLII